MGQNNVTPLKNKISEKNDVEDKYDDKIFEFYRKYDKLTNTVTFHGVYPIGKNSFIKISKDEHKNIMDTTRKSQENYKINLSKDLTTEIKITVKLNVVEAEKLFLSYRSKNGHHTYIHRPWKTDVKYHYPWNVIGDGCGENVTTIAHGHFNSSKHTNDNNCYDKCGNRINITLCEECEYDIVIPQDSDYDISEIDKSEILNVTDEKIVILTDIFNSEYFNNSKNDDLYAYSSFVKEISNKPKIKSTDNSSVKTYTKTYPINNNGFVRIYQKNKNADFDVKINKSDKFNGISIIAKIHEKQNLKKSKKRKFSEIIKQPSFNVPWITNSLSNDLEIISDDAFETLTKEMIYFRGGNRMDIDLIKSGKYTINVNSNIEIIIF
jgi:hypothetical protein